MPQNINHRRRDLLSLAAATLAATQFGGIGPSKGETQSDKATTGVRASVGTFAPLKQVEAGLLNVGYAEAGPPDAAGGSAHSVSIPAISIVTAVKGRPDSAALLQNRHHVDSPAPAPGLE